MTHAIQEKISQEIQDIRRAAKECVHEDIAGRKVLCINDRVVTKYCYAYETVIKMYPTLKLGIRVVCELDFEVYEDGVIDVSDIESTKRRHMERLRQLLLR